MDIKELKSVRETGLKFIADKFKEIKKATNITPESKEFQDDLQAVETKLSEITLLNSQIENEIKRAVQEELREAKETVSKLERQLSRHRQGKVSLQAAHKESLLTDSRLEGVRSLQVTSHPEQKKSLPKTNPTVEAGSLQRSSHAEQTKYSLMTSRTRPARPLQESSHGEHKAASIGQAASSSIEKQQNIPELKLYFMNAGFTYKPQLESRLERNKVIYSVITKHNPDIVCIQEFEDSDIKGLPRKDETSGYDFSIPDKFQYSGNKHAGIIINTETIEVSELEIDSNDIYQNLETLKEYSPIERMHIKRFTLRKAGSLTEFICVSWHGPYRHHTTKAVLSELHKRDIFNEWMLYLHEIKRRYDLPIIAAGDYNVIFKDVKRYVVEPFRIHKYQPSERRKYRVIDFSIGYNISSGNDSLHFIEQEEHQKAILDHDPVGGIFYFIDTSEKVSDEEENTEVTYEISPKKTTRGGEMLESSDGYFFRHQKGDGQTQPKHWICSFYCPATVNEEKGRFNPGMRGHNHTPDHNLRRASIN